MNARDKENKQIQDKLKQFFKKKQTGNLKNKTEFVLTDDVLKDLCKDTPITVRMRTLQELGENILAHKLEENAISTLWYYIRDMVSEDQPKETRDVVFTFLQFLIAGQYERLVNVMRAEFFRFIKQHNIQEDLPQRFELLHVLTNSGKDLSYFEEEAGAFLLSWARLVPNYGKEEEFLGMLITIIKFNAAYLDDDIIRGIIREMNIMICNVRNPQTVIMCLQILDALVAYSNISCASLPEFIGAVCRTVNVKETCVVSWNVMKNLLGTHMGHKTIYIMCRILRDTALKKEATLLRGAVFFIHIALWSVHRINKLLCPPLSVLPSFLEVVKCDHPVVSFEVITGIHRLVKKYHSNLMDAVWDILMQILSCIIQQIEKNQENEIIKKVTLSLHQTLDMIETLIDSDVYYGNIDGFYRVVEECVNRRSDASAYSLIDYLTRNIMPLEDRWLTNLHNLLHKYFKHEVRTNIRLKVLENLDRIIQLYRRQYEDELIDVIIIPHMTNLHIDAEVMFRANAAKLLAELCMVCETKKCLEMLEILEKLLMQPFDDHTYDYKRVEESDFYDIVCLVSGLVRLFIWKIHKLPSNHSLKIYRMLVNFLVANYNHPKVFEACSEPRYMIFECFLKMRADNKYHLGYPADGTLIYSPYLCITYKNHEKGPLGSPPPTSPAISQLPPCTVTYMSLSKVFNVFITSLTAEKDWKILNLILQEIPKVLQNKNLILSKEGNKEIYLLADTLAAMILDKKLNLPESLNMKVNKPDFHTAVLLVLLNMASYYMYMPASNHRKLIAFLMKCIKNLNKCLKNCISALMLCALEMRDTMMKMLQPVLIGLSQTSATKSSALPMLEFLSVLSQLPKVYSNFTGEQYMAIFAITLPYTNPFKYNTYIASLAHYVISVWFLKCRLPLRKEFVKYITTGLQTNVLIPFEDEKAMLRNERTRLNNLNTDSSDRKRSSSLTEQGRPRQRAATVSAGTETNKPKAYLQKPSLNSTVLQFYQELTETCVDLMARYAFQQPRQMKRGSLSDYLLKKGQQMTWVIGRTVVTITTSGCSQNILKNGVCETCWDTVTNLDKKESGNVSRQNSNDKSDNETSVNSPVEESRKITDQSLEQLPSKLQEFIDTEDRYACPCWCMGWAEVHFRRPTGDMIFLIRISPEVLNFDVPLTGLTRTYLPFLNSSSDHQDVQNSQDMQMEKNDIHSIPPVESSDEPEVPGSPTVKQLPSRQSSRESIDEELDIIYDDGTTSRNPVRRSNSSPEMSVTWKNPFLRQKHEEEDIQIQDDDSVKKNKLYSKDMKVSCEAIPEEIAGMGTTPPKSTLTAQSSYPDSQPSSSSGGGHHPSLLSCHSYPGSSPPGESAISPKACQTVPASPNTVYLGKHQQPNFPPKTMAFLKGTKSDSVESTSSEKGLARPSNLTMLPYLPPLSTKPPQSPTQMSPRLPRHMLIRDKEGHEIQKSSSSSIIEKATSGLTLARDRARERKNTITLERLALQDVNQSQKRDRVHTVSVMSSSSNKQQSDQTQKTSPQQSARCDKPKSGLNPSLIFIHMYHSAIYGFKGERALLVTDASPIQRSLKILDSIPPYQTYTIGVIYIGEGQCNNEVEILRNQFGSLRFVEFLQSLGRVIKLQDADPLTTFLGGLEQNGNDGKYAYVWEDDFIKIMFHVATMMPTRDKDPKCTNKKKHIGNDSVVIVYNESGEEYSIDTFKGQMNFASIIIEPLDHNSNRITVKSKDDLVELIGTVDPLVVSEHNVAVLMRQLALHYDLASQVLKSSKTGAKDPYSSNWLERLRKIKQVREKLLEEKEQEKQNKYFEDPVYGARLNNIEDITEYT